MRFVRFCSNLVNTVWPEVTATFDEYYETEWSHQSSIYVEWTLARAMPCGVSATVTGKRYDGNGKLSEVMEVLFER